MTVLFGTLGFTPEKLLGAIKTLPDITSVVFYTAVTGRAEDRKRSEAAVREVHRTLTSLGIPFRHATHDSPFDFAAFLTRFLGDLKAVSRANAVFNLTGGTKPMAVAATVACIVLGIRAYYVPEEQMMAQAIELPIFRIPYSSVLTQKEYRILEVIREAVPDSLKDLAKRLGIVQSTLSGHLRNLENLGAVRLVAVPGEGRSKCPELTEAGNMLLAVERHAGVRQSADG